MANGEYSPFSYLERKGVGAADQRSNIDYRIERIYQELKVRKDSKRLEV